MDGKMSFALSGEQTPLYSFKIQNYSHPPIRRTSGKPWKTIPAGIPRARTPAEMVRLIGAKKRQGTEDRA